MGTLSSKTEIVNILLQSARCFHWGELYEGYRDLYELFFTIAHQSMIISKENIFPFWIFTWNDLSPA